MNSFISLCTSQGVKPPEYRTQCLFVLILDVNIEPHDYNTSIYKTTRDKAIAVGRVVVRGQKPTAPLRTQIYPRRLL